MDDFYNPISRLRPQVAQALTHSLSDHTNASGETAYDPSFLSFDFNDLTALPSGLEKETAITTLCISFNELRHLEGALPPNLEKLCINGSFVESIALNFFSQAPALKEVQLKGNLIRSINLDIFSENKELRIINLFGNNLTSICFKNFDPKGVEVYFDPLFMIMMPASLREHIYWNRIYEFFNGDERDKKFVAIVDLIQSLYPQIMNEHDQELEFPDHFWRKAIERISKIEGIRDHLDDDLLQFLITKIITANCERWDTFLGR